MSTMSPLALNVPLAKSMSFLVYWMSVSFLKSCMRSISMPGRRLMSWLRYEDGLPSPYMHETDATIMTSRLSSWAAVAECLSLSISSLMSASFSMYMSVDGT